MTGLAPLVGTEVGRPTGLTTGAGVGGVTGLALGAAVRGTTGTEGGATGCLVGGM